MLNVVTLREFGDSDAPWQYPCLNAGDGQLIPEPGDGQLLTVVAKNLRLERMVDGRFRPEIKSIPSPATVAVTASRTVVMCHKYDQGGGWVGLGATGLAVAAAANAVSRSRARKRSAGTAFVIQIRHPWLGGVGASAPRSLLDENQVAFVTDAHADDGGGKWRLVLVLDRRVPAADIARDVARRAAEHALAFPQNYKEETLEPWRALKTTDSLPDVRGQFAMHQMPSHFFVGHAEERFTPDTWGLRHGVKVGNKFLNPGYPKDLNSKAAARFGADLRAVIGEKKVFAATHIAVEDDGVHDGLLATYEGNAVALWRREDTGQLRHETWQFASGGAGSQVGGLPGVASEVPVLTIGARRIAIPSHALCGSMVQMINVGKSEKKA